MENWTNDNDVKTIYSNEHQLLTQYNLLMDKCHHQRIVFQEVVHNANLNFLNPYVLEALEISPNSIGHNRYYYTWNVIGTDRYNINISLDTSRRNHADAYVTTHYANEWFFDTLQMCYEQARKYQLGTRVFLVNLELNHYRQTYPKRHQAKINHMKKWINNGDKDVGHQPIPISEDNLPF